MGWWWVRERDPKASSSCSGAPMSTQSLATMRSLSERQLAIESRRRGPADAVTSTASASSDMSSRHPSRPREARCRSAFHSCCSPAASTSVSLGASRSSALAPSTAAQHRSEVRSLPPLTSSWQGPCALARSVAMVASSRAECDRSRARRAWPRAQRPAALSSRETVAARPTAATAGSWRSTSVQPSTPSAAAQRVA